MKKRYKADLPAVVVSPPPAVSRSFSGPPELSLNVASDVDVNGNMSLRIALSPRIRLGTVCSDLSSLRGPKHAKV